MAGLLRPVRVRLLLIAPLPMLVLLPLLLGATMQRWSGKVDDLLIVKVNGDLTIADQYLARLMELSGERLDALAQSVAMDRALRRPDDLAARITAQRQALGLDFLYITDGTDAPAGFVPADWPVIAAALQGQGNAAVDLLSPAAMEALAPGMAARAAVPLVVTAAFASTSDHIGRRPTYMIFFLLGPLLYLSIPCFASSGSADPSMFCLMGFYVATTVIFTMHVGGIHGRLLTAWTTAGVLGPLAITSLRDMSVGSAIRDLAGRVDPAAFAATFGAPPEQLDSLVAAKTVTIARLMEVAPAGTIEPTPGLYNTTMYAMAALLVVAFFANLLMRPVKEHHHHDEPALGRVPAE